MVTHKGWIAMNGNHPRVFVSSTIYDLRDLRSALKMWLEEYGFEVLMSEMNDFQQLPDQNSYLSCLQAIDGCDYFILLVGGRVGGWYDKAARISITQMEYRRAYERLKEGKLKLLVFVRKEIWDIREDRNGLKEYLATDAALDKELSDEQKMRIINHPSKFLNDAEFIKDFLAEVARVSEMKKAVTGGGGYPIGNWVYQFSSFKDIADACRTVLNLSGNLRDKAVLANLKYELSRNVKELLARSNGHIEPATLHAESARASFTGDFSDSSHYRLYDLAELSRFVVSWGNVGRRLSTTALTDAITSGVFLEYDRTSGTHNVGPLQRALMELEGQLERLRATNLKDVTDAWARVTSQLQQVKSVKSSIAIENGKVVILFALYDIIYNIIALSKAAYRALEGNGDSLASLKLHPSIYILGENEKLDALKVSQDEAVQWLNSQ